MVGEKLQRNLLILVLLIGGGLWIGGDAYAQTDTTVTVQKVEIEGTPPTILVGQEFA